MGIWAETQGFRMEWKGRTMIEAVKTYDDVVAMIERYLRHIDLLDSEFALEDSIKERKEIGYEWDRTMVQLKSAASLCDYTFGLEPGTTLANAYALHRS